MEHINVEIYDTVRKHYRTALAAAECCGADSQSCCGPAADGCAPGYDKEELAGVPSEAILGLGCGNPLRFSDIKAGDRVLDLGSGGGIDCFIASRIVGPSGRVIGVDMTPEMVDRARRNQKKQSGHENVEFRLGEIENLPVADGSVDLVISNCVINLSPDKPRVYREAYRVLSPGGRIAVSDMVAVAEIPGELRMNPNAYASCVSGAEPAANTRANLEDAGFVEIEVALDRTSSGTPNSAVYVVSALIRARKPA